MLGAVEDDGLLVGVDDLEDGAREGCVALGRALAGLGVGLAQAEAAAHDRVLEVRAAGDGLAVLDDGDGLRGGVGVVALGGLGLAHRVGADGQRTDLRRRVAGLVGHEREDGLAGGVLHAVHDDGLPVGVRDLELGARQGRRALGRAVCGLGVRLVQGQAAALDPVLELVGARHDGAAVAHEDGLLGALLAVEVARGGLGLAHRVGAVGQGLVAGGGEAVAVGDEGRHDVAGLVGAAVDDDRLAGGVHDLEDRTREGRAALGRAVGGLCVDLLHGDAAALDLVLELLADLDDHAVLRDLEDLAHGAVAGGRGGLADAVGAVGQVALSSLGDAQPVGVDLLHVGAVLVLHAVDDDGVAVHRGDCELAALERGVTLGRVGARVRVDLVDARTAAHDLLGDGDDAFLLIRAVGLRGVGRGGGEERGQGLERSLGLLAGIPAGGLADRGEPAGADLDDPLVGVHVVALRGPDLAHRVGADGQQPRVGGGRAGGAGHEGRHDVVFGVGDAVHDDGLGVGVRDLELGALEGGTALGAGRAGLDVGLLHADAAAQHGVAEWHLEGDDLAGGGEGHLLGAGRLVGGEPVPVGGLGFHDPVGAEGKRVGLRGRATQAVGDEGEDDLVAGVAHLELGACQGRRALGRPVGGLGVELLEGKARADEVVHEVRLAGRHGSGRAHLHGLVGGRRRRAGGGGHVGLVDDVGAEGQRVGGRGREARLVGGQGEDGAGGAGRHGLGGLGRVGLVAHGDRLGGAVEDLELDSREGRALGQVARCGLLDGQAAHLRGLGDLEGHVDVDGLGAGTVTCDVAQEDLGVDVVAGRGLGLLDGNCAERHGNTSVEDVEVVTGNLIAV